MAVALFFGCMVTAQAQPYTAGKHYKVLNEPVTSSPEVREYYSFYCPACKSFNGILPELMADLADDVTLNTVHIDFMGSASKDIQFMLSKATLAAKEQNIEEAFKLAMFNYIQKDRAQIDSITDVRNVFVLAGGDSEAFMKSMKSFTTNSHAKRLKKQQDKLVQQRAMLGVPTFVVNGKYVVNAQALDKNDFINDYKNILKYLTQLKD